MNEYHYTYRAEWSPDDGEWVGQCVEFPSLSWLDGNPVAAIAGIAQLVAEVVKDMYSNGEKPPQSLSERHYSGKLMVRTSPELHKRLTIEAAERNLSLNQWTIHKLAERQPA